MKVVIYSYNIDAEALFWVLFALFKADAHYARIHFPRVCQRRAAFTTMDEDKFERKKPREQFNGGNATQMIVTNLVL